MSEHQQTIELLANILDAIERNTVATIAFGEALAGVRNQVTAAKVETTKAIEKAASQKTETPADAGEKHQTVAGATTPVVSAPLEYKRDVAPTMARLLAAKGAPAVVSLLAGFGVKKGADLPADKLADALAAANLALES